MALDDELRGSPGLRFVERDRRREQRLFSSLNVDAGEDVILTIDVELQELLERCIAEVDVGREKAAVVLDARTGEVLAIAGAPLVDEEGEPLYTTPALLPTGNPAVGSVAKPFVMLEQLDAQRRGRPHAAAETFRTCTGKFARGLACGHSHYDDGLDPVQALSKSCNFWFFSAARGLGKSGLINALRRVGWAADGSPGQMVPAVYRPQLEGLPLQADARPQRQEAHKFEMQAIGYGVYVNVAFVARAYAALATGYSMPPRLVRRATHSRLPLDVHADDLATVRAGLRECVRTGTASSVDWPALPLYGKTGTAEISSGRPRRNNAWFAGFTESGRDAQLTFAAVLYDVPSGSGGGRVAAPVIARLLHEIAQRPALAARYLPGGG